MVKAHTPINWENEPSYNTPLNAANLNKMDSEIGILDDRIIEQDTIKLDKATANTMVKAISFDENTGVFTITLLNGSTTKIDTKLEKVVVNFGYDATTQQIILNLVDGTTQYIDLSALITQYEFVDSDTIGWEVTTDGKVKAKILDGSITENMLQPNYLAEIKVESAKAETNAIKSQSYAVGGTSSRQNEDIDNARYYYEQAKSISESFSGALVPMGTVEFEDLPSLEDAVAGWMYNISNEFVTTDEFKEGAGHTIPLGANIFKTVDNFWDLLSGGSSDLIVDTVEGVNPSIDNSTDGNLIYLKNSGYTKQDGTPTPDAPIEIKGLGDSGTIEIDTTSKNLFDSSKMTSKTINGVTLTNDNGVLALDGTATDIADFYLTNDIIDYVNEYIGTYTMTNDVGLVNYINVQGRYIGTTFTTTENEKASSMFFRVEKDTTFSNREIHIQVEKGATYTGYTPYQGRTQASIPISAPLYEGDYIELFADGSGQIVRTKGVKVFKGDEYFNHEASWTNSNAFYNSSAISDIKPISGFGTKANILCSHLKADTPGNIANYESNDGLIGVGGTSGKQIFISIAGITTPSQLNTFMKENPITVVYELAKTKNEPLTAEQVAEFKKLQTFKGITHITADGEVTIRYYCNNDSGDTAAMLQNIAEDAKPSIANNLTTTTEGMVLDATQGKALNDKIDTLNYSLENRLSKSLVSKETINIDSLSLSSGGHSTITSEEISKSGYTLVGANFFLRGSYAENIIASFTIGGSSTKIYNFAFYNPSDYNISAYGYVNLIYVANSL